MPKSTGENCIRTTEAARHLGVVPRTIYRLIDDGELRAFKVGHPARTRKARSSK